MWDNHCSILPNSQAAWYVYGICMEARTTEWRYTVTRERFRLQTAPEHIIDKILACGVSNAGNGWTDEVISAHILANCKTRPHPRAFLCQSVLCYYLTIEQKRITPCLTQHSRENEADPTGLAPTRRRAELTEN